MLHAVGQDLTVRRPLWPIAVSGGCLLVIVVASVVAYLDVAALPEGSRGGALLAIGVAGGAGVLLLAGAGWMLWRGRASAENGVGDHAEVGADGAEASERQLRERIAREVPIFRTLNESLAAGRGAGQTLIETCMFLDHVIENIPAMVFAKDATDHRFLLVNRAGEALLGIDREELIGKNDYDFFPKEQADHFVARDREVLASGDIQDTPEEPITTRDKGLRLLHTRKIPVRDEQGSPRFLLALIEDITERRQAEMALQESEATFRSVLAASPDAMVVVDAAGAVQLASSRVEPVLGYAPDELVGTPFAALLPEPQRADYAAHLRDVITGNEPGDTGTGREVEALRKDGSTFCAEITVSPIRVKEGPGAITAIRDITERRATEIQLRQAQKMEAVGQLTGGLAHDFNNLLTIVVGNLDLLADQLDTHPQARELAGQALEASLRGAELTRQLLAFSRRQSLDPAVFEVNRLVASTTALLRRTLGERVEVRMQLADDAWPALADPAQVESVLANLAINARDAMPDGGYLTVETANAHLDADYAAENLDASVGDYVMLAVSDTGSGIPPEVLERVFEPFFTTKSDGKGSGLGLSMVYGFAKQSGGHVKIYSEIGHGTTVRVYLPRADGKAADPAAETAEEAEAPARQATILVVEDNADVRRIAVGQLRDHGYEVIEADGGDAAMAILAEDQAIDLLFTDVVMPGRMTGMELARAARELRPELKVLFTSGFTDMSGRGGSIGQEIKRDALISKPYRRSELTRRVREALSRTEDR